MVLSHGGEGEIAEARRGCGGEEGLRRRREIAEAGEIAEAVLF